MVVPMTPNDKGCIGSAPEKYGVWESFKKNRFFCHITPTLCLHNSFNPHSGSIQRDCIRYTLQDHAKRSESGLDSSHLDA